MVFPSTPGVSVRVLRPMFVPGCGGPHEFVNSVSFSHFLPAVIPLPPRSVSHLLSPCSISPVASSFATFISFTSSSFSSLSSMISPLPFPPLFLLFPSLSHFSSLLLLPPTLSSLPQRSHGSLVVRLLEGIPTPPPPPLEPLSFLSLRPLPPSLFFFSLQSPLSLFLLSF